MRLSIFPSDDSQQIARIERVMLAAVGAAFAICMTLVMALAGYVPVHHAQVFSVLVVALIVTAYALIRSGLNLRFSDPNLTVPFLMSAALVISYIVYHGAQAPGAVIALYLIAFIFGVLTLPLRQLVPVALFYWLCLLGVIVLRQSLHPGEMDPLRELFGLVIFIVILGWFVALGWYINKLKHEINIASEKMAATLATLDTLARVDALTGCYNRRYAMELLAVESKRVERGTPLSICLLDIDRFKQINDSYGHATGDDVLRQVADTVQPLLRATDVLARYGGEEFLLILSQTRAVDASRVCERVRRAIAELQSPSLPPEQRISVSIGTAEHHAADPMAMTLQRADKALYEAKDRGRNCVASGD